MIRGSKKIIMSVLTLTLTFIALGTITFAWFSLSTVSNIGNISGSVRGGEGLEVRLAYYGKNQDDDIVMLYSTPWKSNLNESDVKTFLDKINNEFEFNAVSTTDGSTFTKMATKNLKSVVNGADAQANEDYLQFVIQFKSPTEGKIKLDGYTLTGTGATFSSENKYYQINNTKLENRDVIVDPSNGARFSLVGTKGVAALKAYQKDTAAYNDHLTDDISGNTANDSPLYHGQYSFLTDAQQMELYYDDSGAEKLIELDGSDIPKVEGTTAITMFPAATSAAANVTEIELVENTGVNEIDDVDADELIAELTITIWLEGWDVDTYDALYTGKLILDLVFVKEIDDQQNP